MSSVTRPLAALVLATATLTATASAASASTSASACEDVSSEPTVALIDPASLASFGPLAAEPALQIDSAAIIGEASYVPGGVLVETVSDIGGTLALTLIDESGSIRWRRCQPADSYLDVMVAPPPVLPDTALALRYGPTGAITTETIDLATGTGEPVELASGPLEFAASSPGWVLFQSTPAEPAPADAALTLVDLSSVTATSVPLPSDAPAINGLHVSESGTVGVSAPNAPSMQLAAVFVDGAWSTDAAVIDAEFGVYSDYAHDAPMTFYRASGAVAFTTDLVSAGDEGFHDLQVDDVVIVRGCGAVDPELFTCDDPALAAFDVATGAELWRLDGHHFVVAAGDGFALGPDLAELPNALIDIHTGEPVEGQTWPDGTFLVGCCGDPAFTTTDGGALLTSDGNRLSLYVPELAATPTVGVTI